MIKIMIIYNKNQIILYKLKCRRCNCYVISNGKDFILIDTSVASEKKTLLKSLEEIGVEKLVGLVITHVHTDHVGNAAYIEKVFKCPVFVASKGIQVIESGNCAMPKGTNPFTKAVSNIISLNPSVWNGFEPCIHVEPLEKDTVRHLLGIEAYSLATPGHTEDSMSIIINHEVVLVGDAMVHGMNHNIYPPFADDEGTIPITWKVLLDTGATSFYPSHGGVNSRKIVALALEKRGYSD